MCSLAARVVILHPLRRSRAADLIARRWMARRPAEVGRAPLRRGAQTPCGRPNRGGWSNRGVGGSNRDEQSATHDPGAFEPGHSSASGPPGVRIATEEQSCPVRLGSTRRSRSRMLLAWLVMATMFAIPAVITTTSAPVSAGQGARNILPQPRRTPTATRTSRIRTGDLRSPMPELRLEEHQRRVQRRQLDGALQHRQRVRPCGSATSGPSSSRSARTTPAAPTATTAPTRSTSS